MGSRCTACGELFLPPREICPACRADAMAWAEFSGDGRLAAFTAIYIAPTLMLEEGYGRDKPYTAGVVETAEGPRISARILGVDADDAAEIAIGTPLTAEFETRGEGDEARTYLAFRA
jgi:uncharacterized OB-fold protein